MPEDKELIKEILNGSQAAMEVLTRKYYKTIFSFVYRKVGNKDIAYELTQEIFIKIIQRIQSYSGKGNFNSWLFTIAINHCRDYWRSADYKRTSIQSELPETITSEKSSVSYIFDRKQSREQVKWAINRLPDYQKEAIILKYFHQMKIKGIAEVTNTNVSTVKSRLKQGLGKLAKLLDRGEEDAKQNNR
ncbi:RNA polymerase sigma factor [Paenisporosarcina indica]|uniref:RNA polymerase sigma factor n=1 Tax=Paenisporosarcina indica TaxID=650093 RepID=UPI000A0695B1|nr:RNA polymerase sigma factor [Paenisporosarcina indica]